MAYEGDYLKEDPQAQKAWRQRLIRLTRAVIEGDSIARIAAEEGVTPERIRQIAFDACIYATQRAGGGLVKRPDDGNRRGTVTSLRTHQEFWGRRLRSLERRWKLPKTSTSAANSR